MFIQWGKAIAACLFIFVFTSSTYPAGAAPPEPQPTNTPPPPDGEVVIITDGNDEELRLPLIVPEALRPKNEQPVVENDDLIEVLATAGQWTGTTSRRYPLSFRVSSSGTTWTTFKLKTNFSVGGCRGTIETTVFGPAVITNNRFSFNSGTFSFSGRFTSANSASGTYAYINHNIPRCGNFTQSGAWTAVNTTPIPLPPDPPSNLRATALSQTLISLIWSDNSNNETGFKIEQSLNGVSGWSQIATTPANFTSRVIGNLTCNTTYYFRVRAYNAAGNSAYSSTANTTTRPCSSPPPIHTVYLPILFKAPVPPPDGYWTGMTNLGQPMSFNVSGKGTTWNNFKLKTTYSFGSCSGTLEVTIPSSGAITNNQFNHSSGTFSFSGQLTSLKTAEGTYSFVNNNTGCGLLNQSGTWTASLP